MTYLETGRYKEAIGEFKKAINRSPNNLFTHMALVFVYDRLDRKEDARKTAAEILGIDPEFSVERDAMKFPDDWILALRNAGLK